MNEADEEHRQYDADYIILSDSTEQDYFNNLKSYLRENKSGKTVC